MLDVGDKVRYLGENDVGYNVTRGNDYEIAGIDIDGDAYVIGDDFDRWFVSCGNDLYDNYELVTESQPDVHALIANLGRRLREVEAELAPKEYEEVGPAVTSPDAVNSPDHYKRGKFETIEVIEEITQGYADGFVAHCAGTAIKYIARAPYKHATPTEDLRKAAKYLEFSIKRLEAEASE